MERGLIVQELKDWEEEFVKLYNNTEREINNGGDLGKACTIKYRIKEGKRLYITKTKNKIEEIENAPMTREIKEVVNDEWNKIKHVLRDDLRNQESRFYQSVAREGSIQAEELAEEAQDQEDSVEHQDNVSQHQAQVLPRTPPRSAQQVNQVLSPRVQVLPSRMNEIRQVPLEGQRPAFEQPRRLKSDYELLSDRLLELQSQKDKSDRLLEQLIAGGAINKKKN